MNNRKLINLLAYIAIILITISTVVSFLSYRVFNWSSIIATICNKISYYISCLITLFCAFHYAASKRNTSFMFILILFVIALILFTFVL